MAHRYYEQNTSGMNFDRFLDKIEEGTAVKLKKHYWTAKQLLRTKLGKKEDEYLTQSDACLDSKLTLFHSLRDTCEQLLAAIENYQAYLLDAAHAENGLGKYLKDRGKKERREETGKVMIAVGRALMFSSHQRAAIIQPVVRFYQELHVFTERAIGDCGQTVEAVEKARIEYRGSLLWMKQTSEELDPDGDRPMEKFREAQSAVRMYKERLDRLKLDTLQKVDLLSASRSNLLSHLLGKYLETLVLFYSKTAKAYTALSANLSVCNHYDFEILTDLIEPSRKLAQKIRQESIEQEESRRKSEADTEEKVDENLVSLEDEVDESLHKYLFGRESPIDEERAVEEERTDSPLIEEESRRDADEQTESESPFKITVGPLPVRFDATQLAPRLPPPPTSQGVPVAEPSKSHIFDLLSLSSTKPQSHFPNPFDGGTTQVNNDWALLLSQCDAQNSMDLI